MDLFGDLPPPSTNKEKETCTEKNNLKRINDDDINTDLKESKVQKTDEVPTMFGLHSCIAERKGEREDMQDAATLIDDCTSQYHSCHAKRVSFFGVFDGHGGKEASQFAKNNLHLNINKHFPNDSVTNFDKELKKSLIKAFKETDDEFLTKASKENPPLKDGSTATCVLVVNNTLYVANIGDSRTILVRKGDGEKGNILPLSTEHSPTKYEERQRIQNAGGFVKDGRVQGIVEVSRAFGDYRFKKYIIATPDVIKSTLTHKDRYLILACDGLWKCFTPVQAANFIDNVLKKEGETKEGFSTACSEIANEAIRRGSADNVTVACVQILQP